MSARTIIEVLWPLPDTGEHTPDDKGYSSWSLRSLQARLREVDANGWATLEDGEQDDRNVLIAALQYVDKLGA